MPYALASSGVPQCLSQSRLQQYLMKSVSIINWKFRCIYKQLPWRPVTTVNLANFFLIYIYCPSFIASLKYIYTNFFLLVFFILTDATTHIYYFVKTVALQWHTAPWQTHIPAKITPSKVCGWLHFLKRHNIPTPQLQVRNHSETWAAGSIQHSVHTRGHTHAHTHRARILRLM